MIPGKLISFWISASKIMFTFRNHLNIDLLIVPTLILHLSSPASAIRMDVSYQEKHNCRTTVPGRFLLADDNGLVCDALSVDPRSRCCAKGDQFSCSGCNLVSQCCNSYEYCVSCCLNPALVHENAYLSEYHHCFTIPANSSGSSGTQVEARLVGINIIVGSQGESCDSVCKSNGRSCVPNKLALLNQCEIIQKYMSCKGSCLSSVGADQPAEVVDDAPKHLNPGACLYTKTPSVLSCNGSHRHTKRLCPCA